jgi:hypothetical protein
MSDAGPEELHGHTGGADIGAGRHGTHENERAVIGVLLENSEVWRYQAIAKSSRGIV